MNALGTHLLLEMKDCDPQLLDDLPYIREALLDAAREVNATVVGVSFHKFSPHGVTGVVAIAESHLAIHTWPEHRYAAVDIFTCGVLSRPHKAAELLVHRLRSSDPNILEIKRGLLTVRAASGAGSQV